MMRRLAATLRFDPGNDKGPGQRPGPRGGAEGIRTPDLLIANASERGPGAQFTPEMHPLQAMTYAHFCPGGTPGVRERVHLTNAHRTSRGGHRRAHNTGAHYTWQVSAHADERTLSDAASGRTPTPTCTRARRC
jgi:hypothetical protein